MRFVVGLRGMGFFDLFGLRLTSLRMTDGVVGIIAGRPSVVVPTLRRDAKGWGSLGYACLDILGSAQRFPG